ncbi:MAG: SdiA-regulated domain-containing protein [Flavisolibacter sp.]|nr:SdiA-regulated domain-containing protein [Flavisolibacter sp.]
MLFNRNKNGFVLRVWQVFFLLLTVSFLFIACKMFWTPNSPEGYVMPRAKRVILDKKLNEISGIFYLNKDSGLIAITDDKQKIYHLTLNGKERNFLEEDIGEGAADYEDIVMVDSTIYVLVSNGTIKEVRKENGNLQVKKYSLPLEGKNDFETLYYDPDAQGLIMLCKKCAIDDGKKARTAFRFDLAAKQFDQKPFYAISTIDVKRILPDDGRIDFAPSGASIHPIEKRLYILSSAGNLLVITDLKGEIQESYRLKPTLYPQAEGIAFAPNGDMYISNEAKLGKPTLLTIIYNPTGKKEK